jgi:hypothetical protein
MRPGGRVIHDIPAVSVFFFCSSSGMRLGQAVLAFWREKIACQLTKLCRNGKNDQLLRNVLWPVSTNK